MSEKFYVGLDLMSVQDNGLRQPITCVTLQVDTNNTVSAGDHTGLELYAICPYATPEMAAEILIQARGYQYQAYSADGADIDPAAELGDGVTAGRLYSVLAEFRDAGDGYPGISAPGEEELEDEYPYRSETSRLLSNDVDSLRAFISRELGEMAIQISTLTGRIEALTVKVEDISNTVTELESRVSALEGGR